jgi:diguanylate cyclase (GGDEF)-like protein
MINQAESNGKPISLLFIDIDYFKYFNDLYGHQIGDEVLKEIGARISSHLKPSHIAARYGGEEFTVIMYDTAEADAVRFAETIRKDIEKAFDKKYNEVKKITVSIGIGCYPTKAKNKDELIKCADDALYRAKSFHRNRVETFQSVLEELKSDIVEEDDMSIINSMKTLIGVINSKDKYTYRHIERVVVYCGIIADALKINDKDKKILKYGAYLHDIGKINIPEEILNKKMPLTKEEWDMLKQHPAYGVDIVSPVKSLVDSIPIILHHHERYDGGGYPTGLAGEQIPYLARVLTVADCFDAMTSNRPYSIARSVEDAIGELIACSSTQFDPEIVEAFVGVLRDNNNIF